MVFLGEQLPSPAVSVVGRHNSGKTTLVVKLIAELTARGLRVGSVKHHGHAGFDIDVPGKDSYRHRQAGAVETVISAPGQVAGVRTVPGEVECADLVAGMPGYDLVVVEGYRKSGLPTIEIMRAGNAHDEEVAQRMWEGAQSGLPLTYDFVQAARASHLPAPDPGAPVDAGKMPTAATVAVATDIEAAHRAAAAYGIPSFDLNDAPGICDFLQGRHARPRLTLAVQAGGESRRMGRSKALVPFLDRPLIARLVERLAPAADELIVTTNECEQLAFLQRDYPQLGIRLVPDALAYRGALPGFLTAMTAAENDLVAVVACDMVFASAPLVVAEYALAVSRPDVAAVVPVNRNGYEPMHALYRASACLPAVRALLDEGSKRAQDLFGRVAVAEFPQQLVRQVAPAGRCFLNANTPEELASTEGMARVFEPDAALLDPFNAAVPAR